MTVDDHGDAPRLAQLVMVVVFVGVCVVASIQILVTDRSLVTTLTCLAYLTALLFLQLLFISGHRSRVRGHRRFAVLAGLAGLSYLPFLQFGDAWVGIPGFLAGSLLLALPTRWGWTAFCGVLVSVGALQSLFDPSPLSIGYVLVSTTITALVVYGLTRLTDLVQEVREARTQLDRAAVAQERLRVARDLHDLLGYSFSAITLKNELSYRLVDRQPERAKTELAESLAICRAALADVRSVAEGYRMLPLDEELRSARSVLAAADLKATVDVDLLDLPIRVSTVLAIVLREGITNVLRHSKAETCTINCQQTADEVRLEIVNDGVRASVASPEDSPAPGGHGLCNLASRVAGVEGTLSAAVQEDGRFRVLVTVPLPARAPAPAAVMPEQASPQGRKGSPSRLPEPRVPDLA